MKSVICQNTKSTQQTREKYSETYLAKNENLFIILTPII